MPVMSKDLKDALVALLPASQTQRLLLRAQPVPDTGNACDNLIASLPRGIVEMHRCRQEYMTVCTLVHTKELGFEFPGWRERYTKAGNEPKPHWLNPEAKRLWDYCCDNDLRPALMPLGKAWHFPNDGRAPQQLMPVCDLIIRPQLSQLDAVIGHLQPDYRIKQPNSIPAAELQLDLPAIRQRTRDAEDAQRTAEERALVQFNREMDEAGAQAALPLIAGAIAAIKAAADARKYSAEILHNGVGYPGYGSKISTWNNTVTDPLLFDDPKVWEGVTARGLGNWALSQGLSIKYRIDKNMAGGNQACFLTLIVSWAEKAAGAK